MIAYLTIVLLLSGFLFTTRCPLTRFKQLRAKDWSLYCYIFSWGVFFGCVSLLELTIWDQLLKLFPEFYSADKFFSEYFSKLYVIIRNISAPYNISEGLLKWSFLSLVTPLILGFLSKFIVKNIAGRKIAEENDLLYLLYSSTKSGDLLQITLESRKVYIGLVVESKSDKTSTPFDNVVLLPMASGFRKQDDLTIDITNDYYMVYEEISKKYHSYAWYRLLRMNKKRLFREAFLFIKFLFKFKRKQRDRELLRFSIVIPVKEIIHAGFFDFEAFDIINNNNHSNKEQNYNTVELL